MSIVRVVLPVLRGKRRFQLDKGRTWSAVEHLILASLARESAVTDKIVQMSCLPRAVVLESIIRLMHSGLVDLSEQKEGVVFRASKYGAEVVGREELPTYPKRITRTMNLIIDRVTGTVFRRRDMPALFEKHVLEKKLPSDSIWLEPQDISQVDQVSAIASTLLNDDERFVGIDPAGDRFVERYALITVREGRIEGLSRKAPKELDELIQSAAKVQPGADGVPAMSTPVKQTSETRLAHPEARPVLFSTDDLIIGGDAHRDLITTTIRDCRHDLIIHSTFIAEDRFEALRPMLVNAAKRGARVHILWGQDERSSNPTTRKAVVKLRESLAKDGLQTSIKVHPFTTGSHAKIIVADVGRPDRYVAVVGSCNWFYSGFQSFECSLRLREPTLVADIIDQLAELSRGSDGYWTDLTNYFARMAFDVRRHLPPSGSRGEGCLVLGPDHAYFMRKARDEAEQRIFVASHRIGPAARGGVVVPAVSAVERRPELNVSLYYGEAIESGEGKRAAELTIEANVAGVRLRPNHEPRLHAKILAWDNDFVLITSQNWMSADPSESNRRREIGVYVRGAGAARRVIEVFDLLRAG